VPNESSEITREEIAIARMLDDGARVSERSDAYAVTEVAVLRFANGRDVPRDRDVRSYSEGVEIALQNLFTNVVHPNADWVPQDPDNPNVRLRVVASSRPRRFVEGPKPGAPLVLCGLVTFGSDRFDLACRLDWFHARERDSQQRRGDQGDVAAVLSAAEDPDVRTVVSFEVYREREFTPPFAFGDTQGVRSLQRFFARVAAAHAGD